MSAALRLKNKNPLRVSYADWSIGYHCRCKAVMIDGKAIGYICDRQTGFSEDYFIELFGDDELPSGMFVSQFPKRDKNFSDLDSVKSLIEDIVSKFAASQVVSS